MLANACAVTDVAIISFFIQKFGRLDNIVAIFLVSRGKKGCSIGPTMQPAM
jgi:hypothetical protein